MLIEFTVGNYRSFKEPVTLSMVAAKIKSKKGTALDSNNVFQTERGVDLLTSAAIYGANASGKSNLIQAFQFMRSFVINSSRETQATDLIGVENFQLSTETADKPSHFEIAFLADGKQYRYGFDITPQNVVAEWLYTVPQTREVCLFNRQGQNFSKLHRLFKEGEGLQERTRENALFLSVVAQFNGAVARQILECFVVILVISGLQDEEHRGYTAGCLDSGIYYQEIIELIKRFDLGIYDLQLITGPEEPDEQLTQQLIEYLERTNLSQNPKAAKVHRQTMAVQTLHLQYDEIGVAEKLIPFVLLKHESQGTQKIFALAGLLVDTLKNGRILIIDELDARLHPFITCQIIQLFNSTTTNPHHAQLIFATHDTNLLSNELFRRDQIWFTEKNQFGATDLYSLAEFKVRYDASFENDYIQGRYGAVPFIGDLNSLFEEGT